MLTFLAGAVTGVAVWLVMVFVACLFGGRDVSLSHTLKAEAEAVRREREAFRQGARWALPLLGTNGVEQEINRRYGGAR